MIDFKTSYCYYNQNENIYYLTHGLTEPDNRFVHGSTPDLGWENFQDVILEELSRGHKLINVNIPEDKWKNIECLLE